VASISAINASSAFNSLDSREIFEEKGTFAGEGNSQSAISEPAKVLFYRKAPAAEGVKPNWRAINH
jgi:hypothetical protein